MKLEAETIRLKLYSIIADAVERGVRFGYAKAFKYTENPSEGLLQKQIEEAVMYELNEIIEFNREETH